MTGKQFLSVGLCLSKTNKQTNITQVAPQTFYTIEGPELPIIRMQIQPITGPQMIFRAKSPKSGGHVWPTS